MNYQVLKYNPSLDVLRAIAVCLVIINHWVPNNIVNTLPNGMMGVTLFFVLSGYLITNILLVNKYELDAGKQSLASILKTFYIRRSLRIFPIYYITLGVLVACGAGYALNYWPYYFTYTQNVIMFIENRWFDSFSHLWTLAVEEQFYLVWPIILLSIPKRFLLYTLGLIMMSGIFYELIALTYLKEFRLADILLFAPMTNFAMGGVLAYLQQNNILERLNVKWIFFAGFFVCVVFAFVLIFKLPFVRHIFGLVSFSLIALLVYPQNIRLLPALKPLVFIGKISYGLYLYHNFATLFYNYLSNVFPKVYWPFTSVSLFPDVYESPLMRLIILSVILLIISVLSWFLIEKPINSLKSHFNYSK